ncbi:UDP-glucose/GDP-mannose dehydrogenase family protein [Gammaproteobacteria bacterium]|nr:UDP-glucose/GDP-mannose dehydrogenase family protein [Gammaproteobacteria bacterium]
MKVAVVGTGYVGLVSGICLANAGNNVTCVDLNEEIVSSLNQSIPTIHEKGLPELLKKVRQKKLFKATTNLNDALVSAEIVLVAVGTPTVNEKIDLTAISNACKEIGIFIKNSNAHISVVIKSTVIPSTTDTIIRKILEDYSGKKLGDFGLGMNPEFLREGEAIDDFLNPDRIIFGHEDEITQSKLEALYKSWDVCKISMKTRSAEFVKYANNSLLATQISAINELANLSSKIGSINFLDVIKGVHSDKRWNPIMEKSGNRVNPGILSYLEPGCGFGGSCFPKDVQALKAQGLSEGLEMELLTAVLDINTAQPLQITKVLLEHLKNLKDRKVAVLGLAFKADTDDVRESASEKIIDSLLQENAEVSVHDPIASNNFKNAYEELSQKITFLKNWHNEFEKFEIIIIATGWEEYQEILDYDLSKKYIFDARGLLRDKCVNSKKYFNIGSS